MRNRCECYLSKATVAIHRWDGGQQGFYDAWADISVQIRRGRWIITTPEPLTQVGVLAFVAYILLAFIPFFQPQLLMLPQEEIDSCAP